MKKLITLLALVALPAMAGESLLGSIVSAAGADTTNQSTAAPFNIKPNGKITIVCTAAAFVCVSSTTACTNLAGSNPGVPVAASEKFPTSANAGNRPTTGGRVASPPSTVTIGGAPSALVRIVGAGAVTCHVYSRNGDE